jgi:general secretion pathway protein G
MRLIASWLWPIVVLGMLAVMGLGTLALVGCPGSGAKISRVDADLRFINSALKAHKMNAGHYPSNEQGLEGLVARPKPSPPKWKRTLETVPIDAWGNRYRYRLTSREGEDVPEVYSCGKDGLPDTDDDLSSLDD